MITEDDIRRVALALPESSEEPGSGPPGFQVGKKTFAWVRKEGDVLAVYVADLREKELLLASDPEKLFTLPHYDGHPSVLARFSAINGEDLRELLTAAWRARAPERLRAAFDAVNGDPI